MTKPSYPLFPDVNRNAVIASETVQIFAGGGSRPKCAAHLTEIVVMEHFSLADT